MDQFIYIDDWKMESARLFGNRYSAIDYVIPDGARYLEIGVGDGYYSSVVVSKKRLSCMHLLDFFHGNDRRGAYTRQTHREYIINKFKDNNPTLFAGRSTEILPTLNNEYDYIYIDASRDLDSVYTEIKHAARMCSPEGVIGINDYTYYSPIDGHLYQVVEAVNLFLRNNPEWIVIAFQLGDLGYSDIYISRVKK